MSLRIKHMRYSVKVDGKHYCPYCSERVDGTGIVNCPTCGNDFEIPDDKEILISDKVIAN